MFNSQWKCPLTAALKNNQTALRHPLRVVHLQAALHLLRFQGYSAIFTTKEELSTLVGWQNPILWSYALSWNCTRYVRVCVVRSVSADRRPSLISSWEQLRFFRVQGPVYMNCSCVTPHTILSEILLFSRLQEPRRCCAFLTHQTEHSRSKAGPEQTPIWRWKNQSHRTVHPSIRLLSLLLLHSGSQRVLQPIPAVFEPSCREVTVSNHCTAVSPIKYKLSNQIKFDL